MKNIHLTIAITLLCLFAWGQTKNDISKLNLDFETLSNNKPTGWSIGGIGDYIIRLDSLIVKSGKYSVSIEHDTGQVYFGSYSFTLPHNYNGNTITLSGYIKTEHVTDGFAGLWMRIDSNVAFSNMSEQGIKGTTDWKSYKITLPMQPEQTDKIVVGGLLVGKGKMWIDDLKIYIDRAELSQAEIFQRKIYPAENDTTFNNGSNIAFPAFDKTIIDNLELLGKLWGFLKYHHPAIAQGNYNWDFELFRLLPDYMKITNKKQRDQLLLAWIAQYGEIPACTTCTETPKNAFLKPDFSWLKTNNISKDLKKKINEIYHNRHQGQQYYIGQILGVGNPKFMNENPYNNMPYPDAGFRLLALYRYWNMIQYFFPYRYLTDKDWNSILKEYISKFIDAEDELEYELAALQLIEEVHDTHANLWGGGNKIGGVRGFQYAPFRVQFVENKLVVTDYYNPELKETAQLQIGDIITHINGKPVEKIVDSLTIYYPASNKTTKLRDIAFDLLRSNQAVVAIQYISNKQTCKTTLTLYDKDSLNGYDWYKTDTGKCYKFLDNNIGYITLATINQDDIPIIKDIFKNARGIIIDIRNYPNTFVPYSLGIYFCKENTPFVKCTRGNVNNPGEFKMGSPLKISKSKEYYANKVVVLVNEFTQSQAEWTAMAFQAGSNTTIIGSRTAGADGDVSIIYLPGGLRTMISGIGVYYPDETETQRVGIIPDVYVTPTIEGIKNGRDELLEKAIEIINQQ